MLTSARVGTVLARSLVEAGDVLARNSGGKMATNSSSTGTRKSGTRKRKSTASAVARRSSTRKTAGRSAAKGTPTAKRGRMAKAANAVKNAASSTVGRAVLGTAAAVATGMMVKRARKRH